MVALAATDPAQPYGSAVDWPISEGRPTRVASAVVLLRDGKPLAWFDYRAHHLCTFDSGDTGWAQAICDLVKNGELRSAEIRKVNGKNVAEEPDVSETLASVGFVESYKGLVYR